MGLYPAVWLSTEASPWTGAEPPLRAALAALLVLGGGFVAGWTLYEFTSYRLRAELDAGHRLATTGPFRWVRHPIYVSFAALGIGSAIWTPSPLVLACALGLVAVAEWRARTEEQLLLRVFGEDYERYRAGAARFLPGIYRRR